jgi:hypothetical protein
MIAGLVPVLTLHVIADDHGDSPASGTYYSSGITGITGAIEHDIDEDWFYFTAAPSLVYTIQVNNVTLWDNVFAIKAFAEGESLQQTNSVFVSSPSRIVWTNSGGVRLYYIGVSAFLQFTTGTYYVAVSTNDYDGDGDGMADVWELSKFGSLTNSGGADNDGDGFINSDEYYAGTDPTNSASRLAITSIVRQSGNSSVFWPGVSYGTYRIESSTNLRQSASWYFRGRIYRPGAPGPEQFIDAVNTNQMLDYRVVYEP